MNDFSVAKKGKYLIIHLGMQYAVPFCCWYITDGWVLQIDLLCGWFVQPEEKKGSNIIIFI